MARQLFLGGLLDDTPTYTETDLRILNWNIRNPSLSRAKQQVRYIEQAHANALILTEAKNSEGCEFLRNWLESRGFTVVLPHTRDGDYCVLIATRLPHAEAISLPCTVLSHRAAGIRCTTTAGTVLIVGLYVPSRGPIERRNIDKRAFQDHVAKRLPSWQHAGDAQHFVIGGDLNVIERDHQPAYPLFGEWEYAFYEAFAAQGLIDAYKHQNPHTQEHSWFGRSGDGYRFDHIFISAALASRPCTCIYHHDTRHDGLSDHSAMYLHIP